MNITCFFKKVFVPVLLLFPFVLTNAQQFSDSGFEDWSGTQFDGNIQPKYWNFSNVEQLGVKKNFSHRETGRSGYCLKIQDQFVGVGSIGATSPGYVALGQPWAYVSSLTSINDATAGTYGGITWSYRPDSMVVWIKRVYDSGVDQAAGDHTGDENFNLVYYAWTGTSKGGSYKAKDGSCNTSVASSKPEYATDEESDIRLALDGNECGTTTPGTQIAEGWYYEKAAYNSWTKITVPIYYLSDQVPAKCNVILSAGNYPNFRANSGINAGNTLYVDDISLIYSSKVQKLFVNGREWKGFDPDNTTGEQTYSLGQGATTIPEIYAVRGAGSLQNNRGTKATFTGRRLTASECQINTAAAAVDGAPVTITVTAEDGSSSTTYRIKFVSQASDNARLSDIRVNGTTVSGFNAYLTNYNVALPYGTTTVPVVTADPQDAGATVTITQPTSVNGTSTILVTAADGAHTQTYTLNFSVAQLSDNTLQNIMINGDPISGFTPAKANYTVELPLGTTSAPTITWTSAYPNGAQTVTVTSNQLDVAAGTGSATITVSVPGNSVTKTYRLTYKITASSYSKLADLKVGGTTLDGFSSESYTYYYPLPLGTTSLPAITYTAGDKYQTVSIDQSNLSGLDGVVRVVVTAANGDQSIYRINFSLEKSTVNTLQMLYVDGVELAEFDPNVNSYTINLPIGTTAAPAITWLKGDNYQTVTKTDGGLTGTTRISVTSQSGSTRIYQINFAVASSSDATLSMIYLDGVALEGFSPAVLEYNVALPQGTTSLPVVSFDPHDAYQTVNSRPCTGLNGDYKIIVKPQTGSAQTYILHFSVAANANNSLAAIMLDGVPMASFHADTLHYVDTLPQGVSTIPTVTFTKGDASQKVTSAVANNTVTLTVRAESGATRVYVIDFVILKSENAFLKMIYLDGDSLAEFDPQTLNYTIVLAADATVSPLITVDKENGQTITISQPAFLGVAQIKVTPEQGEPNIYRVTFANESSVTPVVPVDPEPVPASTNDTLLAIYLDGVLVSGFQPTTYTYNNITRESGANLPVVTYTKGNEKQVVAMAQSSLDSISLIVMSEAGNQSVYSLSFEYAKATDASLHSLSLNGTPLAEFSASTQEYNVSLPAGTEALPAITLTKDPNAIVSISSTATTQTIDVYAEDGVGHTSYVINYTTSPRTNANLASIKLDDVDLAGFAPTTTTYDHELAWHATALPVITVEAETTVSAITINYGNLNGATTVVVTAEDGTTQKTYTINFSAPLSSDAKLTDIIVDGADYTFDGNTLSYNITLPYGTSATPDITPEKGHAEQRVIITRGSLKEPATVEVLAEDGTTSLTYTFNFTVAQTTLPNVLNGIVIEGIGALNMSDGPDFSVTLPGDSTNLKIVSISKNFPEQNVAIAYGGIYAPTTITVMAEGKTNKVYTITPSRGPSSIMLTSLSVNGTPVPNFNPYQTEYVFSVSGASSPVVTYTTANSSAYVDEYDGEKFWTGKVIYNSDSCTYKIWFHYEDDVIPNGEFDDWTTKTCTRSVLGIKSNWTADIPTSWDVAVNHETTTAGTVEVGREVANGGGMLHMTTTYWAALASAIPSVATLGELSFSFGAGGGTTSDYSGGISFRNSPEEAIVNYKYAKKAGKGALFAFKFVDVAGNEYDTTWVATSATTAFKDQRIALNVGNPCVNSMNIAINATNQNKGATAGADLYVDYIRFAYSSALSALKVNGINATLNSKHFTAELTDGDFVGRPVLNFTGQVADQAAHTTWTSEWTSASAAPARAPMAGSSMMERTASIRNYAEDGTYTDYTLTLSRPKSTVDTCSFSLNGNDLNITKGSPYQTINVTKGDSVYTILVTSESGTTRTYKAQFYTSTPAHVDTTAAVPFSAPVTPTIEDATPATVISTSTQLAAILVNGAVIADYSPLIADYSVSAYGDVVVEAQKADDGQTVVITRSGNDYTFDVTAEDGVSTATYTLTCLPYTSANSQLTAILLDGVAYASFNPATLEYDIVLPSASPKMAQPQMPCVEFVAADSLQSIAVELAPLGATTYATVTAANGNDQSQYALHFTAQQSSQTTLSEISVNGTPIAGFVPTTTAYSVDLTSATAVVTYQTGDAFQEVTEARSAWTNNTCTVTLTVQAEDGSTLNYELMLTAPAASTDATLAGLYIDGALVSGFAAGQLTYSITLPQGTTSLPNVSARLSDGGATSSFQTVGDDVSVVVTAEDGTTSLTYTIHFDIIRSSEAHLQMITLDETDLAGFDPMVFDYQVDIPVGVRTLPDVTWTKVEDTEHVELAAADRLHTLTVTAEDGTVLTYTIHYTYLLSTVDTLAMIYEDGVELNGFQASLLTYDVELPVGTRSFPQLSYEAGDAYQTVAADTLTADEWQQSIRFTATSESGSQKAYVVNYTILKSAVDTLQLIYLDNQPMADYVGTTNNYQITLPYGTTALPEVSYVNGDAYQQVDSTWTDNQLSIHVVAENGQERTYVLQFVISRSNNALLDMIMLDGAAINGFDALVNNYNHTLPYGTAEMPSVTWTVGDEQQTVDTTWTGNHLTIHVTAGDGVTTNDYALAFAFARSTNANLQMIFVDGDSLAGFTADDYEYVITLPYGATAPVVTYTVADTQQVVVSQVNADGVVLTVTAGDETTVNEYTLQFVFSLSPNNYLASIVAAGESLSGFHRDSVEYTLTYPVGTAESALLTATDIVATPEEADATVTITEEQGHTLTIMVTAPNGDIRVYVIYQTILLSSEARLEMIYLDSVELRDFDSDVLEYTVVLTPGANMPDIAAITIDSLAEVEMGSFVDVEEADYTGKKIEIDGVAQDGTRITYTILFRYANWAAMATVDPNDYIFKHINGSDQYIAVTISVGVQLAVYDMYGHMLFLGDVPVADPAFVKVEVDSASGDQKLVEIYDGVEGLLFEVPNYNQPYFYVFFDSKTKRIAKGGKFALSK